MNIITRTALSNFKKNKSRNILIGIAIALTAFLLTIVPTVVIGEIGIEFRAVNNLYPPFHGMYRDVEEETAEKMLKGEEFETVGLREDSAYMYCEDSKISIRMMAVDDVVRKLSKIELKEGRFPEKSDEIVVSKGLLAAMGMEGDIGDNIRIPFQTVNGDGLGKVAKKNFIITGLTEDSREAVEQGIYASIVTQAFADEILPKDGHNFRVYFRLKNTEGMVTEKIEETMKAVGESYGVKSKNIVENSEYLSANYVDGALYSGVAMIMAVVVLAGIITIYSIYYVSMLDKVQEYGKLRAIGATKHQIRKLVLREGFAVAVLAIPIGIIPGLLGGMMLIKGMIASGLNHDNFMAKEMKAIVDSGQGHFIKWWVILLAASVSLITVYLSLLRPMRTASKISAIEAIRYQGADKIKKKSRKGYEEINTQKLTLSNLGRNKRRTIITIGTLGVSGILFMVVATVCNCMDPDTMASQSIRGDIAVEIDWESGNGMHPERQLHKIQQDNPLTEELKEQVLSVDGVERIDRSCFAGAELKEIKEEDGSLFQPGVAGICDEAMKELEKYIVKGSLDSEAVKSGTGIIVTERFFRREAQLNWKLGDKVHLKIQDGEETVEKEFEIAAVTDAPSSLAGYYFTVPEETLRSICKTDVTARWDIMVKSGKEAEAKKEIEALIADQEFLAMDTYEEEYEMAERAIGYTIYGCYGLLSVFGLIGILNLINTMINSVYVRRRELGMLQAIGMSGRQTVNMLQMEGLFYTAGTLVLSLGIGSLLGYAVFLWAREEEIMTIKLYHYPALPAAVLALAVLTAQILVTYLVNMNFKKQSLIERIRFSE